MIQQIRTRRNFRDESFGSVFPGKAHWVGFGIVGFDCERSNALISLMFKSDFLGLVSFVGATAVMPVSTGRIDFSGSNGFYDFQLFGFDLRERSSSQKTDR